MTESNTGSDTGPNTPKPRSIMVHWKGESIKTVQGKRETPQERMARVVRAVQAKRNRKR